ncbi:MAG: UDP-N-acetylmuramoyl-L-alanine--D-glutamate ligase [Bacteriovorax sp.]|nr:UDP-N-acetylmuramoyl-L-alanine--D-glutamate ligase [Bacteriovorax sp.]
MNNSKNDLINFVKNKKIAVFGMGVSGLSAIRFLHALEAKIIAINSGEIHTWASGSILDYLTLNDCFAEKDPHLKTILNGIDLVILSPGISREHPLLNSLHKQNIPIWGELELAYRYLEMTNQLRPIIGITGTNGKTTTTTFLGEMIKLDHKKVFVGGNIGVPFCDYAFDVYSNIEPADFILLELSSFQLESIDHFHVNIAMILNLYQNHGERYTTIEDYGQSKFNITNRFTDNDCLIYPEDFSFVAEWAKKQKGKKKTVNTQHPVTEFDLSKFKLPGIHNKVNLNFILLAALEIGLSKKAIQEAIDTFAGVHHRIEFVNDIVGLPHFVGYNDAKSTNWDATITAVKAMEDMKGNLYLVIGGKKRGHGDSINPYLDFLKDRVHSFYLIGEMADEIEAELSGLVAYQKTVTLEKTVEDLRANKAGEQGVLLFSPGFPSFDQFKNYVERGEYFTRLLQN